MPWRLVGLIIFLFIVLIFTGFNLDHRVDISLGFVLFEQVPIFFAMFVAFLSGIISTLPFVTGGRRLKKPAAGKNKDKKTGKALDDSSSGALPAPAPKTKAKTGFLKSSTKSQKKKKGVLAESTIGDDEPTG